MWPEVKLEPKDDDTEYSSSDHCTVKTQHSCLMTGVRDSIVIHCEDEKKKVKQENLTENAGKSSPVAENGGDCLTNSDEDADPMQMWSEVKVEIDVADTVFLGDHSLSHHHHCAVDTSSGSGSLGPHSVDNADKTRWLREPTPSKQDKPALKSTREPTPRIKEDPSSSDHENNRTLWTNKAQGTPAQQELCRRLSLAPTSSAREPTLTLKEDPCYLSQEGSKTDEADEPRDAAAAGLGNRVDDEVTDGPTDAGNVRKARQAPTAILQHSGAVAAGPVVPATLYTAEEPEPETATPDTPRSRDQENRERQRTSFRCGECRKEFSSRSALKMHAVVHSGEKPFKCDQCFSAFGYASNLQHHKKSIHAGGRAHNCEICPFASRRCKERPQFPAAAAAAGHGVKRKTPPDQDPDRVGSSFGREESAAKSSDLSSTEGGGGGDVRADVDGQGSLLAEPVAGEHLQPSRPRRRTSSSSPSSSSSRQDKSGVPLVQCYICSEIVEKCRQKHHMSQHSLTFRCQLCSQIFACLEDLTKHAARHGRAPSYKCRHCYLRFTFPGNLATHLKRAHSHLPGSSDPLVKGEDNDRGASPERLLACDVGSHPPPPPPPPLPAVASKGANEERTGAGNKNSRLSAASIPARGDPAAPKHADESQALPVHFSRPQSAGTKSAGGDSPESATASTREIAPDRRQTRAGSAAGQKPPEAKKRAAGKAPALYKCGECPKAFRWPSHLLKHAVTHTGEKPFKCRDCPRAFRRPSHLRKHAVTHTGIKPFKCRECPRAFRRPSDLEKHAVTHAREKPFKCEQCPKAFRRPSDLEKHSLTHTGEKPFECGECPRAFRRPSDLEKHVVTHSGDKPFNCEQCSSRFALSTHLTAHLRRSHATERPFRCQHCPAVFGDRPNLQSHMRAHGEERPFQCQHCPAVFGDRPNLQSHMRVHGEERPFQCQHCPAVFGDRPNLQSHMRAHGEERPFQCDACPAAFKHASSLSAHRQTHSYKNPFRCEHCPARFSSAGNLQQHGRVHSREGPFKCDECTASFRTASYLRLHKRTHSGVMRFRCDRCDAAFTRSQYLHRHKRTHVRRDAGLRRSESSSSSFFLFI